MDQRLKTKKKKREISFFDTNYLKSFDGVPIYYEQFGTGPPIVFVHGWTGSHNIWERPMHDLSNWGFRTVAADNRGHGFSGKPDSEYDFDEFSSDLRELVTQLDLEDVTLVGWSMGVSISLRYLERFDGDERVSKLVLINGPIKLTSAPGFPHTMTQNTLERFLRERIDDRPRRERKFLASGFFKPHPEATAWLTEIALRTPLHVAIKCVKHQAQLDMREMLSSISIPTLICYGRHDPFYPVTLGKYIKERIKLSRLVIYEKSGHYPFIEESEKFSKDIREFAKNRRHR